MLLQILFSVRSKRQLMEQTQYNMLFRWFIRLRHSPTEPIQCAAACRGAVTAS